MAILLLFLSLILSSAVWGGCAYTEAGLIRAMNECQSIPGKKWVCDPLNRCLPTEAAATAKDQFKECDALETNEEKNKCYQDLAIKTTIDETGHDPTKNRDAGGMNFFKGLDVGLKMVSAFHIIASYKLMSKKDLTAFKKCPSLSFYGAAGLMGILGELQSHYALKSKADDLRNDFIKQRFEDPDNAQTKAFEYLAREQDAIAEITKKQASVYTMEGLLYGTAAALAVTERVPGGWLAGCSLTTTSSAPLIQRYFEIYKWVLHFFIADSYAFKEKSEKRRSAIKILGMGVPAVIASLVKKSAWNLDDKLIDPGRRAVFASVLGAVTAKLAAAALKESKQAKRNAAYLRKAKAAFVGITTGYCSSEKEKRSARCYCFTSENKRDPKRNNSARCKRLWNKMTKNFYIPPTDYSSSGGAQGKNLVGCVNRQNIFDPFCDCKRVKDIKGNNNCKKYNMSINLGKLGKSLGVIGTVKNVDDVLNNNLSAADVDALDLGQKMARLNKFTSKMLDKFNKRRVKKKRTPISFATLGKKMFNDVAGKIDPRGVAELDSVSKMSDKKISNPKLREALKKAKKAAGLDSKVTYAGADASDIVSKQGGKENSVFAGINFSGNGGANKSGEVVGDFMQTNYKYKKDDIHQRPGVPIWQIISHRYFSSALPVLFADEKDKKFGY